MSNKVTNMFNICKKIALANTSPKKLYNFGAVLVKGGSVISTGTNKPKTDPLIDFLARQYKGVPQQCHSEIVALSGVQRHNIRGCSLYVARINVNDNSFRLAKPCSMCEAFLKQHKIRQVYYSINSDSDASIKEWAILKL